MKVLIIEDEPLFAAVLEQVLRVHGVIVSVAHTGGEALRLASELAYDIIISDFSLADGVLPDYLPRLRELQPHSSVLLCSGGEHEIPGVRTLRKPFRHAALLQELVRLTPEKKPALVTANRN